MHNTADAIGTTLDGRDFVFVIMSYDEEHRIAYQQLKGLIERSLSIKVVRADEAEASGRALLPKVHQMVRDASVIIVDISPRTSGGYSPNVFYEYGFSG